MGTPAYRGCPLRDAPFSGSRFAGGATHGSAAERATDVFREDHPYWVYAGLTLVLQSRYGAGLATSSPLRGTAARPSSCLYSPKCLEGEFSELRAEGVLGKGLLRGSSATPPRGGRPHMPDANTTLGASPVPLARYIARSAARTNTSGRSSEPTAMPTLAFWYILRPRISRGRACEQGSARPPRPVHPRLRRPPAASRTRSHRAAPPCPTLAGSPSGARLCPPGRSPPRRGCPTRRGSGWRGPAP